MCANNPGVRPLTGMRALFLCMALLSIGSSGMAQTVPLDLSSLSPSSTQLTDIPLVLGNKTVSFSGTLTQNGNYGTSPQGTGDGDLLVGVSGSGAVEIYTLTFSEPVALDLSLGVSAGIWFDTTDQFQITASRGGFTVVDPLVELSHSGNDSNPLSFAPTYTTGPIDPINSDWYARTVPISELTIRFTNTNNNDPGRAIPAPYQYKQDHPIIF